MFWTWCQAGQHPGLWGTDAIGHTSTKGEGCRQVQLKLEITYLAKPRQGQLQQDLVTSVHNKACCELGHRVVTYWGAVWGPTVPGERSE